MNKDFEVSLFGNMLIYEKGYSKQFVQETTFLNNLDGLRIFDHLDPLDSLDFLKDNTFLRKLFYPILLLMRKRALPFIRNWNIFIVRAIRLQKMECR